LAEPADELFGSGRTPKPTIDPHQGLPLEKGSSLGSLDDIAALTRVIAELQHENGFRIDEIASLRMEIELLKWLCYRVLSQEC